MPETNGAKRFGRRALATVVYALLVTVSFYYSMIKGADIAWFSEYTKYMFGALGFLIGGLTATDVFNKFK